MRYDQSLAAIMCAVWLTVPGALAGRAQGLTALVDAGAAVDDARLLAAARADGDWMTFGRDYSNHRFAPFGAINRTNVSRLAPAWVYELGTVGSVQTHPLVVGGVMYVGMAGNDVAAVNAATGAEIWRYRHRPRSALPQVPSNRGVAVAYGRVFEATDDARVIALDQATGAVVWDQVVPPFDPTALHPKGQKASEVQFNFRAAPLVYDGKVIVGATGFEANRVDDEFIKESIAAGTDVGTAWINANLGRRGFVSALDARTGAEVWRWYSTKEDGWEGDYAAAAPDGTPLHRDITVEKGGGANLQERLGGGLKLNLDDPGLRSRRGAHFRRHWQSGARRHRPRAPRR
jgi:alcohol dehydrogenase (cytochrome c)